MKKTALIIVLSLFLTACSDKTPGVTGEQEKVTANAVETEKKAEETEKTASAPVFVIEGELPDIGEFSGSSYDSYFDEPVYDFVPGDYEKILPYIASVKDFDGMKRFAYGFCDSDGKIIMDASYSNVGITYMTDEKDNGIYRITKELEKNDGDDDEFDIFGSTDTVMVDGEGKWSKTLNGGWCNYMYDGVISATVINPETDEFKNVIYGYDGEEILVVDDYDYVGEYNCHLLYVNNWEDEESMAYFINLFGTVVLGPYKNAQSFNKHGIAPVTDFDGKSYLIDTKGHKYADKGYTDFSVQYSYKEGDGVFVMTTQGEKGKYDIYSADAVYLGSISDEKANYISLRFPENGEALYYYTVYDARYENSETFWRRLSDGTDFKSLELGKMPDSYNGNDDFYVCTVEDNKAYVIDCFGETVAVLDDYYNDSITFSKDGRFIAYNAGEYSYGYDEETEEYISNDSRRFRIYDSKEQKVIYEADRSGYAYFVGDDERYMKISLFVDVDMFAVSEHYVLFDTETERAMFDNCAYIEANEYYGDWYYNVCTENTSTLYDSDFNVIRRSYYE